MKSEQNEVFMQFKKYAFIFIQFFCFALFSLAAPLKEKMDLSHTRIAIEAGCLRFIDVVRLDDAIIRNKLNTEETTLLSS